MDNIKKISSLQKKRGNLLNEIRTLNEWLNARKLELSHVTQELVMLESETNPYDDQQKIIKKFGYLNFFIYLCIVKL